MITCRRCGSTNIRMFRDARGLPEAHCAKCGSAIKKMSTGEVIDYFEDLLEDAKNNAVAADLAAETPKPLCKYCTEDWYIHSGRFGMIANQMDIVYCPMCGRKLQPDDRKY